MAHHVSQLQAGIGMHQSFRGLMNSTVIYWQHLGGCLGWVEGEQWGYCMVQLLWVGGVFLDYFFL